MRKLLLGLVIGTSLGMAFGLHSASAERSRPEDTLLPEKFQVFVWEGGAVNQEYPDTQQKILPTRNLFKGNPGCYVACYSHQSAGAIYPVGLNLFVMGQMRVEGNYSGRICVPASDKGDISAAQNYKDLCTKTFPTACADGKCWAGGDTGGWFGIQ